MLVQVIFIEKNWKTIEKWASLKYKVNFTEKHSDVSQTPNQLLSHREAYTQWKV